MKKNLTRKDVTPEVIKSVWKLLAHRAVAEVTREKVDAIQREVLKDVELFTKAYPERGIDSERIHKPSRSWVSEDGPALQAYYEITDAVLKEKEIKPKSMDQDYCPALVAEHDQVKAEWALLDAAAEMLDLGFDGGKLNSRLLCLENGLERRQEFINILVGLVVNL